MEFLSWVIIWGVECQTLDSSEAKELGDVSFEMLELGDLSFIMSKLSWVT